MPLNILLRKQFSALLLIVISSLAYGNQAQTDQTAIVINQKQVTEKRLPCNSGKEKFCNLRIYQVMVESFVNGDKQRGFNAGYGPSQHHGDLQGIINSLDYIKSLNVNAIWLTPIFDTDADNDSADQLRLDATGYFAHDFFKIDPHFGTLAQAQLLVKKAHEKGLYVFLDGVFGHAKKTGVVPSPTGKKPTLIPCVDLPANYPGLCAKYPESRDFFVEVATYWVNTLGIDGWRLDQAYQVPVADWAIIQNKVVAAANKQQRLGYMVAEIWSDEWSNMAQRIQQDAFGTDEAPGLMSAFDFPVRYGLVQVLATQENTDAKNASRQPASILNGMQGFASHAFYPGHAIPNLMIGNHDTVRFGNLLQRAKIANPSDAEYWQRHRLAFAFMAAYSGPITIYYGDEIGDSIPNFSQKITDDCLSKNKCDDHVSRTDAKILGVTVAAKDLNPEAIALKNYVASLMQLKAQHPALYSGSRTHLASGKNYYIDLKTSPHEQIVFIMNTESATQTFKISSKLFAGKTNTLSDLLDKKTYIAQDNYFAVTIPALSAQFLFVGLKSATQPTSDNANATNVKLVF